MTHHQFKILVLDDETELRNVIFEFLQNCGFEVLAFSDPKEVLREAGRSFNWSEINCIVSDLNMPEMSGLDFLELMHQNQIDIPLILITAFGGVDNAIEATKKGVFDYVTKPLKLQDLRLRVERACYFQKLQQENKVLKGDNYSGSFGIIGKSKAMQSLFQLIEKVAKSYANILITGESGTGKERVARAIHDQSDYKNQKFVAVNCAAIPDTLLESELFGHERGAFTGAIQRKKGLFEEADGGTLFLDEIGDMDLSLQAKVLRAIQEKSIKPVGSNISKTVNVRLISASHRDLKQMCKKGMFRDDLYYRLSVIPVFIPPLRERQEDVPLLAKHFLEKYSVANNKKIEGFKPNVLNQLMLAKWEGNVRELENLIERLVVLSTSDWIELQELPELEKVNNVDLLATAEVTLPTLEDLERQYIKIVLEKTNGRKEKTAKILGINRRTLYRKEREYGFVKE